MSRAALRRFENAVARPAAGSFGEAEMATFESPVRRMFEAAVAPAAPLVQAARIRMRGEIRLRRWTRFAGTEILAPHAGFLWAVRAGAISGFDRYLDGEGEMRWKLLGLVPVMRASGLNVSRSAAGRVAAEAVWVPTALLPRFGVTWSAVDELHLDARYVLDGHDMTLHYALDDHGRIGACWFERWGDPDDTGAHGLHPFGMETTAHRTFGDVTVPSEGRVGWHFGTGRWEEGVFFRYELTSLGLLVPEG